MKLFLLLLITFATYFNIQAQEWELLDDNDDYSLFIRSHSEESVWVKWEYKKPKVSETLFGKDGKIKQLLRLYKFDCDNKLAGTMAEVSYDENGEVLSSEDKGRYFNNGGVSRMKHVIPDSTEEFILFKFCESQE